MKSIILALCLIIANVAKADNISFIWDPVTTGIDGQPVVGLLGYKLYVSNTPGTYGATPKMITASNTTEITETVIGTYYAVVRAYNETGESANSSEVTFTVKPKIPTAPTGFRRVP